MIRDEPRVHKCAACADLGWVQLQRENATGVAQCECKKRARLDAFVRTIPPRYGDPGNLALARLRPHLVKHGERVIEGHQNQGRVIGAVRTRLAEDPLQSFLFAGDNGVGKSHLAWSIALEAATSGRPVRVVKLPELMEQYHQAATFKPSDDNDKPPEVAVTPGELQQPHARYCLVLDEAEKATPTEFAAKMFFNLMNAVYEYRHQLIVMTNVESRQLIAHWSRWGRHWGNSIARRMESCVYVRMFRQQDGGSIEAC